MRIWELWCPKIMLNHDFWTSQFSDSHWLCSIKTWSCPLCFYYLKLPETQPQWILTLTRVLETPLAVAICICNLANQTHFDACCCLCLATVTWQWRTIFLNLRSWPDLSGNTIQSLDLFSMSLQSVLTAGTLLFTGLAMWWQCHKQAGKLVCTAAKDFKNIDSNSRQSSWSSERRKT